MPKPDPKRTLRDLGRRVAELRVAMGLTQEAFAEMMMNVSTKYLQRIEAGRENLTVESLVVLASKFRVPVRDLFDPPASRAVRLGRPPKPKT